MAELRRESAEEYFKELVDAAIARQHLKTSKETKFYIVNMLASFMNRRQSDLALGVTLLQSLHDYGMSQHMHLKEVGDNSLFLVGVFDDYLRKRLLDPDYFANIGCFAYDKLSQSRYAHAPVYVDLSQRFLSFADVLTEVSERAACLTQVGLLRLYEKWLAQDDPVTRALLIEHGLVLNRQTRKAGIQ